MRAPLVLHGSSGVSDRDIARAVGAGRKKVNISTHLNRLLIATVRARLAADAAVADPRKYLGLARERVAR